MLQHCRDSTEAILHPLLDETIKCACITMHLLMDLCIVDQYMMKQEPNCNTRCTSIFHKPHGLNANIRRHTRSTDTADDGGEEIYHKLLLVYRNARSLFIY